MTNTEFTLEVLRLMALYDETQSLMWQVHGGVVEFHINCSDVFWWGCADAEEITPNNLPLLEQSLKDVGDLGDGPHLFVSRVRKLRPQGAMYKYINGELWPLFDECGPDRPAEFGNPYDRERVEKKLAEKESK